MMKLRRLFQFVKNLNWFFLTVLLAQVTLVNAHAQDTNIAFLPVKITYTGNSTEFTKEVDTLFQEKLSDTGVTFIERANAEKLVKYSGTWPPSAATLKSIAAKLQADQIITGNLVVLGSQISLDTKMYDPLSADKPLYFSSQGKGLDNLDQTIDKLAIQVKGFTQKDTLIAAIVPKGNTRIDSGAVLRKVQTKVGDNYNPADLRQDLKNIYKMGYFDDVQIEVTDSEVGKKVAFLLVEKPVITSLTVSGYDELDEEEVNSIVNIKEQSILNPSKINESVEMLKAVYRAKGYYNTQIETDISYPNDKNAVVEINIDEGEKTYIKNIAFNGNETFDDDELIDEMETKEKNWFLSWLTSDGLLKNDQLKQDAGRITAFYHNNGFLKAKVSEPVIEQEEDWFNVTYNIEEGVRYKVGQIDIQGDLLADKAELLELLNISEEEYISRKVLREDTLALTDFYSEKGYAFANIRPNLKKSASSDDVLDINITIGKGELVYISRITIGGNDRTRDNVIRRELQIEEGGIFDSKALRQSTEALHRLGYFEEVNVTPEPTLNPSEMEVNIDVKERNTGTFSIGVGYSSVDDVVFSGSISENNFLGRGDKLSFTANLGGSSSRYDISYTNPHLNDSQLSWGFDLFNTEREYDDYTKDSMGGKIRIGYPLIEKWRLYGSYAYTDTEISDIDDDASSIILRSKDIEVTSAVKFSLIRDTRNRRFSPTKGSRHTLSAEYAGGPFGGDAQFTKLEASTSWYFPLFFDTAFHVKGAAGQVFENEDDKLPVYERFYLGGLKTIRGFEYNDISPVDEGDKIGGDKMWYSNLEFIFPLLKDQGMDGVIFYDIGRVMDDDEDWTVDDFDHGAGVEVRWISPMGPLRIGFGVNLDPEDDEDETVWDFTMGGTF